MIISRYWSRLLVVQ